MTTGRSNTLIHLIATLLAHLLLTLATPARAQSIGTPFPSNFRNTQTNKIEGEIHMSKFFLKIKQGKTVKVMQIGDSHVRGNIYPNTTGKTLKNFFPHLEYTHYGINGAWAKRFYEQDMIARVAAQKPDLVIISFGTNEAHGSAINESVHSQSMLTLTDRIREKCPGVEFLFTTPPGSFISRRTTVRSRGRRRTYTTSRTPNAKTGRVARSIVKFCQSHKMAVWDIYTIGGGDKSACTNWLNSGLMNTDAIHFLASGYALQGKMLGEAIHKAYTETAVSGSQTRMMHEPTPREQQPYRSVQGF